MRVRGIAAAAVVTVALVGAPSLAAAQTDPYVSEPPKVGGVDEGRAAEVGGVEVSRQGPAVEARGETLPVTGGDIIGLTILGAASIAAGSVVVRRARRPVTA